MVKDTLNSVFDNLKERTTNPFLGTLIVVWTLKNWELVYSLFYFDSSLKLDDRLAKITDHFKDQSFLLNMGSVILITMGVLILTYTLLSLSRLVTDAYERIVIPVISKLTDRSSVVLKSEYVILQEVVKKLEVRLEEERLAKVAAQTERDSVDAKLIQMRNLQQTENISEGDTDRGDTNDKEASEVANGKSSVMPVKGEKEDFRRASRAILSVATKGSINKLFGEILNDMPIDVSRELIAPLLIEGIIAVKSRFSVSQSHYAFTDLGKDFLGFWRKYATVLAA
jgi:hypothetical protein